MDVKILIAEDHPSIRELYRRWLCCARYPVHTVENGADALHALLTGEYTLGILDIRMMPMDGLEVAKYVRQKFNADDLPLIALTADATLPLATKCTEAGFNLLLTKPIYQDQFMEAVRPFLRKQDSAQYSTVEWLDPERVAETLCQGEYFFEDIEKMFFGNASHTLMALANAIEGHRLDEAKTLLHFLIGSAQSLGASAIASAGEQLGAAVSKEASFDELQSCLFQIDAAIKETISVFEMLKKQGNISQA